jgi:predicted hydrolase (HD superfamily)
MELTEARALVKDKTDKDITVRHLISVEGVMRALGVVPTRVVDS